MGTIRTRTTKTVGPVRTTTSWGGPRGITTSTSSGNGKGIGRTRVTYSTNQKTGRSRYTQSMKIGKDTWYTASKTEGGFRRRGRPRKYKGSFSDMLWFLVGVGLVFLLMFMV